MKPTHHPGDFVFCSIRNLDVIKSADPILLFKEEEGYTIILQKEAADNLQLNYSFVAAWITVTVHSSLEAVGLTAAFSTALADAGISCNVVAGYYHDHLFVDKHNAERAIDILNSFST